MESHGKPIYQTSFKLFFELETHLNFYIYIYVYLFAGLLGYIPVPSDFLIPVLVPVMGFFTPAVSRLFSIRVSHAESHSCFPICRPSESLRSMNGIRHQFLWFMTSLYNHEFHLSRSESPLYG